MSTYARLASLTLTLAVLAVGCGGGAPSSTPSSQLAGAWNFPQLANGGLTIDTKMTFSDGQLTYAAHCEYGGESLDASVQSRAEYTNDTITVLDSGEQNLSQNGVNCSISLGASDIRYRFEGSQLQFLGDDGSVSARLSR